MRGLERRCFVDILRVRYRHAKKKEKGKILDQLCCGLSIGRRQGMRLLALRPAGRPKKPEQRGRPPKYQVPEFIAALRFIWRITRYMCGRALKSAIPQWLPFIEGERGKYSIEIRIKLYSISASSIDRILKPYKVTKGISFTRSTGFRDEIPVQGSIWEITIPGFVESDTVAHCGGSMHGEFINSVVIVDIATIWTEARAVVGRGSGPVLDRLREIEKSLPFELLGYDADNGGEVLNQFVLDYFVTERIRLGLPPVQVTRSREYRKNDNAHVEQRNDSIARQYLGYERLDFPELTQLINYYYACIVCPLRNHFYPSFKLKDKVRIKSRTRRIYDAPVTAYQRVIASPHVTLDRRKKLMDIHSRLNPLLLVRQEQHLRRRIDEALKRLKAGKDAAHLLALPESAPPLGQQMDAGILVQPQAVSAAYTVL